MIDLTLNKILKIDSLNIQTYTNSNKFEELFEFNEFSNIKCYVDYTHFLDLLKSNDFTISTQKNDFIIAETAAFKIKFVLGDYYSSHDESKTTIKHDDNDTFFFIKDIWFKDINHKISHIHFDERVQVDGVFFNNDKSHKALQSIQYYKGASNALKLIQHEYYDNTAHGCYLSHVQMCGVIVTNIHYSIDGRQHSLSRLLEIVDKEATVDPFMKNFEDLFDIFTFDEIKILKMYNY